MANKLEFEVIQSNKEKLIDFMELCNIKDEKILTTNVVVIGFDGELIKCISNQSVYFSCGQYPGELHDVVNVSFVNDHDVFKELELHYSGNVNFQEFQLNKERNWLRIADQSKKVYYYIEGV